MAIVSCQKKYLPAFVLRPNKLVLHGEQLDLKTADSGIC